MDLEDLIQPETPATVTKQYSDTINSGQSIDSLVCSCGWELKTLSVNAYQQAMGHILLVHGGKGGVQEVRS